VRLTYSYIFPVLLCAIFPTVVHSAVTHKLNVSLEPTAHKIKAVDVVQLQKPVNELAFLLHGGLKLTSPDSSLRIAETIKNYVIPLNRYVVKLQAGQSQFTLNYEGEIYHPVEQQSEEYARSFSETPGLIGAQGVFLAQSTYWYPVVENEFVHFSLETHLPTQWQSVSQGTRKHHDVGKKFTVTRWEEYSDQEEIYLTAAPYKVYQQSAGAVAAMVYLLQADDALAQKYLDATAQYVEMYRSLIGPYPYDKFALVENFWETGYGMPSFTLLGSTVIRLPFIVSTSYPHEILHNWWGNSVYVDYTTGNWAEGLTAYLSDHLTSEQRGQGDQHRRQILQHYTDFVDANKDFPLSEFRSRHSSVTEAIGYGKTQMFFHMLRQQFGDDVFEKALHRFYRKYKGKIASFEDWRKTFVEITEKDLSNYFDQWISRTGAPQLQVKAATAYQKPKGFELELDIVQIQNADAYQLEVPVAITVEGEDQAIVERVKIDKKQQKIKLLVVKRPQAVNVDPQFDIFRRVDLNEIPPALSQAFGADEALFLIPSMASSDLVSAYRQLAEDWQKTQSSGIEIKLDSEVKTLPDDRAVWIFGSENVFFDQLAKVAAQYQDTLNSSNISLDKTDLQKGDQSLIFVTRNPTNMKNAIAFVTTANSRALPGLARKLPHYRKYSYLAFEGDEPSNTVKGQFPVNRSPMQLVVTQADGHAAQSRFAAVTPQNPLTQIPTVFDEKRMLSDVNALVDKKMAGRGLGSTEIDLAADYIANAFKEAGLTPGFPDSNTYFQTWSQYIDGLDRDVAMKNVVGFIPGINPQMKGESVVISAHYDHLGRGWPDVRKGNEGKIHSGADDNASGIAVMLELARLAAKKWRPERTIVFVAFTAEESGKLGSSYYVKNYRRLPAEKVIGVLNLDTVGRLKDSPVSIFNSGSATEWPHIFRGAQFVTGVNIKTPSSAISASDDSSFIDIGIPAVQLFGSVHEDFHSPGDTIEKIDSAGMVKVVTVLKEAAEYLSSRPEPLTSTISDAKTTATNKSEIKPQGRKVSVGTIPDFEYSGEGVRITGVTPDSPAQNAGMKAGDIITSLNGKSIKSLGDYAKLLRSLKPGDHIKLGYQRAGQNTLVELDVSSR